MVSAVVIESKESLLLFTVDAQDCLFGSWDWFVECLRLLFINTDESLVFLLLIFNDLILIVHRHLWWRLFRGVEVELFKCIRCSLFNNWIIPVYQVYNCLWYFYITVTYAWWWPCDNVEIGCFWIECLLGAKNLKLLADLSDRYENSDFYQKAISLEINFGS